MSDPNQPPADTALPPSRLPPARPSSPRPPRPGLEAELSALDWSRAHRAPIQMRYGDLDTLGHLNNAVYVQYLETARLLLWQDLASSGASLGGDADRSVIARLELDYRHEIRFGQEVVVEHLMEHIGRTSWTLACRIVADDLPCAYARTVQVKVDGALRHTPIPQTLRDQFAPMLVEQTP